MKWKYPQLDDKRVIKRFLFLPKIIHGEGRWLEFATIAQRYSMGEWNDMDFVD